MKHSLKYIMVAVCAALPAGLIASSWDMALESTERAIARAEQSQRKLPVEGEISSAYGMREHPLTEQFKKHRGIDIAAAEGTAFYAAEMGRVTFAGAAGSYGNMVELLHIDGSVSRYAHASVLNVQVGQRIHKGEVLGLVGATGAVTGAHLHYEMLVDGQHIDPAEHHNLVANATAKTSTVLGDDLANEQILADLEENFADEIQLAKAQARFNAESQLLASKSSVKESAEKPTEPTSKLLVSRLVPFKMTNFNLPAVQTEQIENRGSQVLVEKNEIGESIKQHMANISKLINSGDLS